MRVDVATIRTAAGTAGGRGWTSGKPRHASLILKLTLEPGARRDLSVFATVVLFTLRAFAPLQPGHIRLVRLRPASLRRDAETGRRQRGSNDRPLTVPLFGFQLPSSSRRDSENMGLSTWLLRMSGFRALDDYSVDHVAAGLFFHHARGTFRTV